MLLGNCAYTLQQVSAVSSNLKIKKVVKILGVHFTYDLRAKQKLNVDELISSIQEKLRIWRWRDLTIIGRIQIVKAFMYVKKNVIVCNVIVIFLPTEHLGVLKNSFRICPCIPGSNWNSEMLVFEERGKPEYPEKNLSEQSREATTNSTHI